MPGVYSVGHNAIGDSLLIRRCPAEEIDTAVAELIARADDPHIGSSDRGNYLRAAVNLSRHVTAESRAGFFADATRLITAPTPSEHDALNANFTHELGGIRMNGNPRDSRGQALLLASELADDDAQRGEVRRFAYAQLGEESDYWPTIALQRLGDAVKDDLAFLASQGWAIRSLAAILWVDYGEPAHLGIRLASDPDVRVRKAFADTLAKRPKAHFSEVKEMLMADPAYSVRKALNAPHNQIQAGS